MKHIKKLSHRNFIYLNKDTPNKNEVLSYLLTISSNQYQKFLRKLKKRNSLKNIKKSCKHIYRKIHQNRVSINNSKIFQDRTFEKTKTSLVPQPEFSSYQELQNSLVNTENISGYWGEHIIREELKTQKFLINNECRFENKYGDLDIITYKKQKNGKISVIEFHEIKTLTKGCTKENINLSIESQVRHLLSPQQRKGGEIYVQEVLTEQEKLGNFAAKKLLQEMKTAEVRYFLHKIVIDKNGKQIPSKRQSVVWEKVKKKSIVWAWVKNLFFQKFLK